MDSDEDRNTPRLHAIPDRASWTARYTIYSPLNPRYDRRIAIESRRVSGAVDLQGSVWTGVCIKQPTNTNLCWRGKTVLFYVFPLF